MQKEGILYLIPSPLGLNAVHSLPTYVIEHLHRLDYFIAERAKTARRFIKETQPTKPFSGLHFSELNKRTTPEELNTMLQPALEGHDMGLLSEAGCPGVADPGAQIVAMAHQKGIRVAPLVGPSSILLALMASGMNGQQFCFHGYLPAKKKELRKRLQQLEQQSAQFKQCQIFIETPYRNQALLEDLFKHLSRTTRFCIAADLTLESEYILSQTIDKWRADKWRKANLPDLHKRPAIYILEAAGVSES